jgi:quinol monooxygenase YgiN
MELLIVTLARVQRGSYDDTVGRLRLIVETVKNAQGMMNARLYTARESDGSCLILTSWEDEESWQRALDRHNPRDLLIQSTGDVLAAVPEQWTMYYLWGYSRPAAQPLIAEAHIATIQPDAANRISQQWLDALRRQAASPALAFAFLARGTRGHSDEGAYHLNAGGSSGKNAARPAYANTFLNLLSWPGEAQRKEFYADQRYRALQSTLNNAGMVQVLALDPS